MKEAQIGPAVAQTDRQSKQEVKLPKIFYYAEKFWSGENNEFRSIV